ncbi:MAG: hypothetical protein GTO20_40975 [Candidatus Aminicenantes bacterium]|nr:hypothetical protein [Candidatus Aminicenantes bacterium]
MFISFLIVIELIVFNLGIYSLVRKRCDSVSMAFSYSAILTLATLSLSIQLFFFLGIHGVYFLFDIVIIVFSVFQIIHNRDVIKRDAQIVFRFLKKEKLLVFILLPVLIYLSLQAFLLPPGNLDSMVYNLARVLMFKQEGSLFLENYSYFGQPSFPVGYDLLSFLFLRFNSDFGLAIFSFISYVILIVGTFSIVGCFYNKKLAVSIAIIIASLTEIVLQATTTKNDIPAAAVVVVIFLAGYNFIISRRPVHLYLVIVGLLWGVTIKGYFAGFALPFILFYAAFLIYKQENFSFTGLLSHISVNKIKLNYKYYIIPVGLILCIFFFYGHNIKKYGNIFGEKGPVVRNQNQDGVIGGILNLGRYIIQSAEIPIKYGYKINEIHDGFLKEHKSKGMKNKKLKIDLSGKSFLSEDHSWYGPLAFFLIIPVIAFSVFFAKGYVRVVSLTLSFYFILLSYKVAWMPWNNRYFSLFFAGSGICIAYVFNRFLNKNKRVIKGIKGFIVLIAIYTLLSATLQNSRSPTIPRFSSANLFYNLYKYGSGVLDGNRPVKKCFAWLGKVSNRQSQYEIFYPRNMLTTFISSVERDKRVLVMGYFIPVFPLLLTRPDLEITVSRLGRVSLNNKTYSLSRKSDYMSVRANYDYIVILTKDVKKFKDIYRHIRDEEHVFYSKAGSIFRFKKDTDR